jgi:hypothetical protein
MSEIDATTQTPVEEAAEVEQVSGEAPADGSERVEPETTETQAPEPQEDVGALKRRLGELRDEVGRLRIIAASTPPIPPYGYQPMATAPSAPAAPAEPDVPVTEEELFTNPKAVLAKIKTAAVEEARRTMREESARDAQLRQLEDQFYAANKDLDRKRDKRIVDAVASELFQEIGRLHPYQAQQLYPDPMKEVANRTRDYMRSLLNEARTKQTTQPLHVGPGGGVASAPTSTAPAQPKTKREEYNDYMAELRAMTIK